MKRLLCLLITAVGLLLSSNTWASQTKVVFINPGHKSANSTGEFWPNVSRFMQAAADDLNIELITLFANRDHLLMKNLARRVHQYQPDFVIIVNEKGVGIELVKTVAQHNYPIFTLLNGFSDRELARLTAEQKKLLIGSLVPNNYIVGQSLISDLYQLHHDKVKSNKPYELLVLRGDYTSAASVDREQGLLANLTKNSQLHLFDNPVANWSKLEAYKKVKGILQHKQIDIIWAANDPMAYGASRAVKEAGLSGKVTIGGINWDKINQDYPIAVSYGGHVILGAKALVMLSDYQAGIRKPCQMDEQQDVFVRNNNGNQQRFHNNTEQDKLEQFDFARFSRKTDSAASFQLSTFINHNYNAAKNTTSDCHKG